MTYNKIHDLVEAALLIKEYCYNESNCENCIFCDNGCRLRYIGDDEVMPHEWKLPKNIMEMHKEYNDTQSKLTADELG